MEVWRWKRVRAFYLGVAVGAAGMLAFDGRWISCAVVLVLGILWCWVLHSVQRIEEADRESVAPTV